jgi:hypothetical protein
MKPSIPMAIACFAFPAIAFAQTGQAPAFPPTGQGAERGQHPPGPPPNIAQAIALLDQAKAGASASTIALISQAETFLERPPPHRQENGMQGPPNKAGAPSGSAAESGPP